LHVTEESSYHISVAQLFMKGEGEYSVQLRYLVSVMSLGNMQTHNYKMCTVKKKRFWLILVTSCSFLSLLHH